MGFAREFLYIGDGSDNTVKRFDARTGQYFGSFVPSGSGGLNGPRGILFNLAGNLFVSNQNVGTDENGNVLEFSGQTGEFLNELVSSEGEGAPFAPRGIILTDNNVLYVADFIDANDQPGEIRRYNGVTGEFLGVLDKSGFSENFYPRGVVIGPDGNVFVSGFNIVDPLSGWVLRFNRDTGEFLGVFIESDLQNNLHRPEGLVFGPDGNLYITSFRADENDTDKILIFNGITGEYIDKIDLYEVGEPRAFAQALLFGPEAKLYVPITGPFTETGAPDGPNTGAVRLYDIGTKMFDVLVPPAIEGGPLGQPWYLTFNSTDPETLAYFGI
ncbi:NHL repeat-containing protein [Bacillus sp. 31A1R]|uniref:NHL repeat-containing protein n=1 Tax=Robertmurraya mangrovi TaxID=3098077 RepID=A0ABU5J2M3_9BACI|nr:NHL repeat-containing protein [Bacillus sp. 31A1R]MDZ5473661.1 NHL repeat-containing protein [Bacillus sp. 31A1R]